MAHRRISPALVAHGGAGSRGPADERPERRRGLLTALRSGAEILRAGGSAVDAVQITVVELEDHPLFNAGTGSVLTTAGTVEMDASLMVVEPAKNNGQVQTSAGAVAAVSRVRNPLMLARAVMEETPHVMLAGSGAHNFARRAGIALCRNEELVTPRSRARWRMRQARLHSGSVKLEEHGTVGAVAIDSSGRIAAATSTGGVPGKIPGRVGDSAIIGAGTFAAAAGGASATGHGEAIILAALCREAIAALSDAAPAAAARRVIAELLTPLQAEAGIILIDRKSRIGIAHNSGAMQVATYDSFGIRHFWVEPFKSRERC
jgi:beta-aspartyl-peptidase (threonine type)